MKSRLTILEAGMDANIRSWKSIFIQERMLPSLHSSIIVKKKTKKKLQNIKGAFPGVLFWSGSLTFEKYQLDQ